MSDFDYPLLLEPISVPKVWGGGRLAGIAGRTVPESRDPIGESWDVSTWPTAPDNKQLVTVTNIINGPLAGTPLNEVADLPVVVKILDPSDRLSVQNHPVLPDIHKNEMWYILQSDRGGYLYLGLNDDATKQHFCDLLRRENPDEEAVMGSLKRCDDPRPGSHFNIPTGTVHALGPGPLTFEISEKTQVTYRLYDYNRERSRGKLDLDDGCEAVMARSPEQRPLEHGLDIEGARSAEAITQFPTFCVIRAVGDRITVKSSKHRHLVTATMGDCRLSGPTADWDITLRYTFTCLVPATQRPYTIDTLTGGEELVSPVAD